MSKRVKRDPAVEEDLRGWVKGAHLDPTSLSVERIGHSKRWRVLVNGEPITTLSERPHRRLIITLLFIGNEHRAALELATRKLAHVDSTLEGARKGGEEKRKHSTTASIAKLATSALIRGEELNAADLAAEFPGVVRSTVYRAIAQAKAKHNKR